MGEGAAEGLGVNDGDDVDDAVMEIVDVDDGVTDREGVRLGVGVADGGVNDGGDST